jgi:site-specific DNA-methyltransferase (adenine-specific)
MQEAMDGIMIGDALNILSCLRAEGELFDVIIADPPYNIGKDFGNNKDTMHLSDYVAWTRRWVDDCFALLAPGGLLYLYGLPEIIARISVLYPIDEQRWLVWHYTNKTVPSSKFWQRSHETILCLWKPGEERPRLEIDQIREPYTAHFLNSAGRIRKDTPSRFGTIGRRTIYNAHKNGALPRDVIKIPALAGGAGRSERWFVCRSCDMTLYHPADLPNHRKHDILKHPTQKPMELTRRLVLSRINGNGGRVLIPFAGSGSECVVAQELGLDFLGIEINPEYARFAREWIKRSREEHRVSLNSKNATKLQARLGTLS